MTIAANFDESDIIDRGNISESYLHTFDVIGFVLSAIITLGPLAATAYFG